MIFEKVKVNDYFRWGKKEEIRVCKCYIKIVAISNSSTIIKKKSDIKENQLILKGCSVTCKL